MFKGIWRSIKPHYYPTTVSFNNKIVSQHFHVNSRHYCQQFTRQQYYVTTISFHRSVVLQQFRFTTMSSDSNITSQQYLGTTHGFITITTISGNARPCRGTSFENIKLVIRNQRPLGKFFKCRSNEVLKLRGASTNDYID